MEPAGRAAGGRGPHAFVSDIAQPSLDEVDQHHLERVLRLQVGDPLTVSDGQGRWRLCRFGPELQVAGEVREIAGSEPELTVGIVPVKGERTAWAVQKLTELGVDRVLVLRADRSVVRWEGERGARQLERLRRVAREAAMQSRRCTLPELVGVLDVASVLESWPEAARAERDGEPPSLLRPVLLVGPEGGWSPEEREAVPAGVGLGPGVLRSETAAVAAAALLVALREQVVRPI